MILTLTLTLSILAIFGVTYVLLKRKRQHHAKESSVLMRMRPKISWCKYLENVNGYGKKLSTQYQTIINIHASALEILTQKFNVNELTFNRYRQTLESTHHLLTDNLVKLIPLLEALDNITNEELSSRNELSAQIDHFFSMNDQLLEKLNELIINLSGIKSLTGPDESTTKFLLDNLDKVIERAKQY